MPNTCLIAQLCALAQAVLQRLCSEHTIKSDSLLPVTCDSSDKLASNKDS